ncbi:hypothetical protein [Ralstonia phage phiRSL1]|uniref:DUF4376 domain-containing protein n=1 Tax=Ralstonia phage phiRSL1 TaxID=1980924 RepID=B2ZY48_9CAUD|nr:tail fiber protein [Ralstonia phage phiRSL1]BAG41643.1 hypothetical protein [Ralstonia phage phiRSL1]
MITVYTYDASGFYTGTAQAQIDPTCAQGNTVLLPPNTTQFEPPSFKPSTQVPKWDGNRWTITELMAAPAPSALPAAVSTPVTVYNKPKVGENQVALIQDGQWTVVSDYRGQMFKLADGTITTISEAGVEPPANSTPVSLSGGNTLVDIKNRQLSQLDAAYMASTTANITYQQNEFQADGLSERLLQSAVIVYSAAGSVPTGFFWQAADNTGVKLKLTDLQALLAAIVDRRWTNFQRLQQLKSEVEDANTADAVTSITW